MNGDQIVKTFLEIGKGDAGSAGGKGASLGEMTQAGIPVPPGFVVLSTVFDTFLKATDLAHEIHTILGKVDHKVIHTIDAASEQIQGLIESRQMPAEIAEAIQREFAGLNSPFVAVRSSATAEDGADHAWAGQLESYLNTTEATLLANVQKCWASLFTPRAIFYRFEKGLNLTHISVAVVVQAMVNSEKSGIAFSVHPVTEDHNQLIIEAGLGLGEAIVSGSVTPDSYVVAKKPRSILDANVNEQSRALYRAEKGGNEWRDLAPSIAKAQVLSETEILELSELVLRIESHYGFPCDIEWAQENGKFYIVQSRPITTLRDPATNKGSVEELLLWATRQSSVVFLTGFIDYTIERGCKVFHMIGLPDERFDYVVGKHSFEEACMRIGEEFMQDAETLIEEYPRRKERILSIARLLSEEAGKVEDEELLALYRAYWDVQDLFNPYLMFPHYSERVLEPLLAERFPDDFSTITGLGKPLEYMLLAKDAVSLSTSELLEKYPHVHSPNVESLSENYFKKYKEEADEARVAKSLAEIEENESKFLAFSKKLGQEDLRLCRTLHEFSYIRTDRVDVWRKHVHLLFPFFEYVGKKISNEITLKQAVMLTKKEIMDILSGRGPSIHEITKRGVWSKMMATFDKEGVSFAFDEEKIREVKAQYQNTGEAEVLSGMSACKGKVQGTVKIYASPKDVGPDDAGFVMVARHTSPQDLPYMKKAAAFVTDEGGITSHTAIVSRELGIPCIIGTKIATQVLKDGDLVEVDADTGVVRVLERATEADWAVLSKVFSREKTLFYFSMWNDSDRRGYRNFLNHEVRHNLFIVPPPGRKGSVWYSQTELDTIDILLRKEIKNNPDIVSALQRTLEKNWKVLLPYLSQDKEIENVDEFEGYYEHLVDWWSAMNTAFTVPDMVEIDDDVKKIFLDFRIEAEKYTEKMNKVMVTFWQKYFPEFAKYTFCIAPDEVRKVINDPGYVTKLEERNSGLCVFNGVIYPLSSLDNVLKQNGVVLEEVSVETDAAEIGGSVAYAGKVQGRVKKILSFADMKDFKDGDILVTEMTNPDYIPVIKIASAIVTDEGGITCHAAIVSRELKKPCIIGTKIATQVLKDGDLVEVDADTGVVRVIQKDWIDYAEWEYEFQQRNKHPLLAADLWLRALDTSFKEEIRFEALPDSVDYIFTADAKGWVKKAQKKRILEEIRKRDTDTEYLEYISRSVGSRTAELEEVGKYILSAYDSATNKQLADLWEQFEVAFIRFVPWFYIPWYVTEEEILTSHIARALEPYREKIEAVCSLTEAISLLTYPDRPTTFQQAENAFQVLLETAENEGVDSAAFEKAAAAHAHAYGFLATWLFLDIAPKTTHDVTAEVVSSRAAHAQGSEVASSKKAADVQHKEALLKIIGDDKEAHRLISWAQEYAWLLTNSVEEVFRIVADLQPFFRHLSMKLNIPYADFSHLTGEEIAELLREEMSLKDVDLSERREGIVIRQERGKKTIATGAEAVRLTKEMNERLVFNQLEQDVSQFEGKIGYRGVVRGRAKICLTAQDAARITGEEVLVTSMTTPDFVPAMKAAVAIVTDEGGLLSHAAIIARELQKPCIIGTKIATQVLKDGDLVEVDANTGVVRILEAK